MSTSVAEHILCRVPRLTPSTKVVATKVPKSDYDRPRLAESKAEGRCVSGHHLPSTGATHGMLGLALTHIIPQYLKSFEMSCFSNLYYNRKVRNKVRDAS